MFEAATFGSVALGFLSAEFSEDGERVQVVHGFGYAKG